MSADLSQHRVIFGFPRTGTKLLAQIHKDQGYHNFGEFFDPFANDLVETKALPRVKRKSVKDQHALVDQWKKDGAHKFWFDHGTMCRDRVEMFPWDYSEPSIVTVWPENLEMAPELLHRLSGRTFLCTRRVNKFENMLSRVLTYTHKNYEGEVETVPVRIAETLFAEFFYKMVKTERIQRYLLKNHLGLLIDFDELIAGTANVGFPYEVKSKDEHLDLRSLVLNHQELRILYWSLDAQTRED